MSKKTRTKRALLSSVIALILCCAMLLGTTFAWFTDTASTAVNTIKSGNLDVDLVDANGTTVVNKTLDFVKAAGASADEAILWEPGCTYKLPEVYIQNNGNLALKYKINITGVDGDAKLLEAIEWTIKIGTNVIGSDGLEYHLSAGEKSSAITISGHMTEEAGNEYQDLSIEGIGITVVATQWTEEHDSFGNQYDADAETGNVVKTFAELKQAVADGGKIILGANIEVPEMVEIPVNGSVSIDGQDFTLTRADSYTGTILSLGEYAVLALSNITLDGENVESSGNLIYIDSYGKLTLNGGTVLENHVGGTEYDSDRGPENSVIHCDGATTIVMNDGSVIQNNVSKGNFATVIASMYDLTCELNGGKIINNTSEKNNYTVNFGNYANITVSDGFEAYGNTDGGLMRVNQQSTFTMNGGKLDGNGKAAIYTWVAKYVTLNGGEIVGNVYLNYAPATVGGTDVDGRIQKDKEVTKWALNLTPDFGTVRYYIEGNITQLNIVPAEGYTYVAGDENKLICENTGYETYWDAESACFKVKTSE